MNSEGTIIAIGAKINDGNYEITSNSSDNRGHVRVHGLVYQAHL